MLEHKNYYSSNDIDLLKHALEKRIYIDNEEVISILKKLDLENNATLEFVINLIQNKITKLLFQKNCRRKRIGQSLLNEILNILQQENIEELNDVFLKKLKQLQPDKFLSLSEETKEKVHDICEGLSQKSLEAFIFFKELHDKNQNEGGYTISKNELITLKLLLNNFKKEYESCGRKSKILIRLNKNISDAANFKPRINFMEIIGDYDDFMRIITK